MNKKQEIIREHLICTCSVEYKSRNMKDPTCFLCEYGTEIEMMMDEVIHAFIDWHNTSDDSKIVPYISNSMIGKFNLEIKTTDLE